MCVRVCMYVYVCVCVCSRFQLERQEQLAEKDQRSEQERRARLDKAQEAIKGMYEERSSRKTQQAKLNREQEADFVASQHELESLGNVWERVVRLVDLEQKPNRKDVARFRQVLIQCKNNPVA
eukprot:TRINITY_DN851_c0_g2_i1.p3 TRINITY_DN851_c0_g2~~TRINITY_DN851_c0_g2_i1.p3  ORF type:complete len:123 (-),score=21.48 TRINITY_DN851_c0_g2_i1:210-578(-)